MRFWRQPHCFYLTFAPKMRPGSFLNCWATFFARLCIGNLRYRRFWKVDKVLPRRHKNGVAITEAGCATGQHNV